MKRFIRSTLAVLTFFGACAGAHADPVRIAVEGAYPPFNYVDSSNQLHGFDVDIANALCSKMKSDCKLVAQDWDGMIPGLMAKKYDAIVSSMVVTKEREEKISFTNRYYRTRLAISVPQNSKLANTNPQSFKGLVVGAQSSTTQGNYAQDVLAAAGATVKLYPAQDDANLDLAAGRLDAVVNDKFPNLDWLAKDGKGCCKLLGEVTGKDDDVAIAVRKNDNGLRERLNKAIAEIIADGTYQRITSQYFKSSIY
ncbi:transporter substrate-binding domain-containing protein [Paraburkholderia silviterrae]|uniref:Transporter substrate-binding domain-containing protein n=1 Tax=Paraburkholderia silviterrae TaxID=2528715 RepID=A0A4R5M347_9BURK|nr:transporter substrate-binding domain-containing protein [Paraburkholderia silviterrae]TDG19973.1 transporter substrate-binding domain-containing protein [Paraburkholderia silviterrae]